MIDCLIQKYKPLFIKHKRMILYVFFGGITTAVNYITYYLSKYALLSFTAYSDDFAVAAATVAAWITAVLVAFMTNKLYVFESKSLSAKTVIRELMPFILARLLSFFMDLGIMIVGVNLWGIHDFIVKTVSNVFVLVFNYIASKLFIFKNK